MASALRNLPLGSIPNEAELKGKTKSSSPRLIIQNTDPEGIDTTFPIYCTTKAPSNVAQIYARSLLSSGHGFGLNDVVGNLVRPEDNRELGSLIGDVGCMNKNGSFDYCFNIFFPKDHEIQSRSIPESFSPLEDGLVVGDAVEVDNYMKPGTVIASEGIHVRQVSETPLNIEFESSAREAAALVLPTGAHREELVNHSRILPYLRQEAAGWYRSFNGSSDGYESNFPIGNGSLWIVTGVDRVDSWAMATLPNRPSDVGKPMKFVYKQMADSDDFTWENLGSYRPHFRKHKFTDGKLGAIFLRVLCVALSHAHWKKHVAHVAQESVPYYDVLPTFALGLHGWLRQVFLDGSENRRSSNGQQIFFHPSLVLVHILLLTNPDSDIGVVADSIWRSKLGPRHFTHSEVVRLTREVISSYDMVIVDGVATFVPKSETTSPPVQEKGLKSYVARLVPWISGPSKERHNLTLQNMNVVLGLRKR